MGGGPLASPCAGPPALSGGFRSNRPSTAPHAPTDDGGAAAGGGGGPLSALKGAAAAGGGGAGGRLPQPGPGRASVGVPGDVGRLRDQLSDLTV